MSENGDTKMAEVVTETPETQKHKLDDSDEIQESESPTKKLKSAVIAEPESDKAVTEDKPLTNGESKKPVTEAAKPVTEAEKPVTEAEKPVTEVEKPVTNGEAVKDVEMNEVETAQLKKQINRQVEYYFGDVNLPKDKFLQDIVKEDDGWVSMETMMKFNRLVKLSADETFILNTLKSLSTLMEVDIEGKKIRRDPKCPLPEWNEERREDLAKRTLYVKGFSTEKPPTLDDLLVHFKQYGDIENITLRTNYDKLEKVATFKGSIFMLFKLQSDATKFMELDAIKYLDAELIKKWQKDWIDEKKNQIQEKKIDKRRKKEEKQSGFQNRREAEKANKAGGGDAAADDDDDEDKKEAEKEDQFSGKGVVLQLSALSDVTTREDIKEALLEYDANVAYIDSQKGDTEAKIRLRDAGEAVELHKKLTAEGVKLTICDTDVEVSLMEEEAEAEYLKECRAKFHQQRSSRGGGRRGGGGRGGRGRRGGGRGGWRGKRR